MAARPPRGAKFIDFNQGGGHVHNHLIDDEEFFVRRPPATTPGGADWKTRTPAEAPKNAIELRFSQFRAVIRSSSALRRIAHGV